MKAPTAPGRTEGGRAARTLAAALIALALGACSPGRVLESVELLTGLTEAAPGRTARPAPFVPVRYAVDGRAREADLYLPGAEAEAAVIVVPGAAQEGRRDPRLVAFAENLASARFLVLVPELAGEDPLRVSAADAVAISDAVEYLAESADAAEVGLAALSYAVGPTLLAALRPDTAHRVGFVLAVGGYHDVVAAITYLTTGAYRAGPEQDRWLRGDADPRAKWLFLLANADRVGPPDDRILAAIARARLAGRSGQGLAAFLRPPGRAVYRLLTNRDPDRVPRLIAELPAPLRDAIGALDLAGRDFGRLEADLILVHGRDDPMVPWTESVDLARAAPPGQGHLFLLDELHHVDLGTPALGDALTLVRAAYRLLAARDAAPAPAVDVAEAVATQSP